MDHWAGMLELKTVDVSRRLIAGYAAVHSNIDRVGDIIDPGASVKAVAQITDPARDVAVFIAHNSAALPIGLPQLIQATPKGLYTETYVLKGAAGDNLLAVAKDLQDHGHALGLSIGYKTQDSRRQMAGTKMARRIMAYSLKEYSFAAAQAIANPEALVTAVKSMSAGMDSAGGFIIPANAVPPPKKGAAVQYRVEQNGDRWIVYADADADGDADDNVPVGTYPSAEMANAVVVALRKAAGLADDGDTDDDQGKTAEAADERKAVWSTAMVNALPNSSFLWVEPGEDDDEGKRVPRSKRHLPYKDAEGKVDVAHLRDAIARIPQTDGLDAGKKAQLQARARRLLANASDGKTADEPDEWKTGSPVSVAALGYTLIDLAEQVATELKAMSLLGEETKGYQRIRASGRQALRDVAAELVKLADHAERIDKGEDGIARLNWLKQQFALTEV